MNRLGCVYLFKKEVMYYNLDKYKSSIGYVGTLEYQIAYITVLSQLSNKQTFIKLAVYKILSGFIRESCKQ